MKAGSVLLRRGAPLSGRGSRRVNVPRSPPPTSPATSAVMKANRARDSAPEVSIRRNLRKLGMRGFRVAPRGMPGRPDIVFVGHRLAIFVHGCFWHQHGCNSTPPFPKSNVRYWKLKFRLNKQRDARKTAQLKDAGWRVLVLWECRIKQDPEKSALRVVRLLRASGSPEIQISN